MHACSFWAPFAADATAHGHSVRLPCRAGRVPRPVLPLQATLLQVRPAGCRGAHAQRTAAPTSSSRSQHTCTCTHCQMAPAAFAFTHCSRPHPTAGYVMCPTCLQHRLLPQQGVPTQPLAPQPSQLQNLHVRRTCCACCAICASCCFGGAACRSGCPSAAPSSLPTCTAPGLPPNICSISARLPACPPTRPPS